MIEFLKRLKDPSSEERQLYRQRKAAGACPLCGRADPGNTYCPDCYEGQKAVVTEARKNGTCVNCFILPVAPPKKRRLGANPVSWCLPCRQELAARLAQGRQKARDEGVCCKCLTRPVAPPKAKRKVSWCLPCRNALAARKGKANN
jgi:hypothetical protein